MNEGKKVKEPNSIGKEVSYLLWKIGLVVGACFILFTFVFGMYRCHDDAMEPALKYGDLVIYYRLDKRYVATESIALKHDGIVQVRRVLAIAGDVVDLTEEGLLVNGALIQENEIYEETLRYTHHIEFPVTVKEQQVFVLGDKRKTAKDSREYGCVDIENTLGKVVTVIRRRDI